MQLIPLMHAPEHISHPKFRRYREIERDLSFGAYALTAEFYIRVLHGMAVGLVGFSVLFCPFHTLAIVSKFCVQRGVTRCSDWLGAGLALRLWTLFRRFRSVFLRPVPALAIGPRIGRRNCPRAGCELTGEIGALGG